MYNSVINGTIRLCHNGCGNFLFLVVNGQEYGNIWLDDRASTSEILPLLNQNGNRITFEEWFFKWLDDEYILLKEMKVLQKSNSSLYQREKK